MPPDNSLTCAFSFPPRLRSSSSCAARLYALSPVIPKNEAYSEQVFDHREFGVQGVFLRDDAQSRFDPKRVPRGIHAEHEQLARRASDAAIDHLHRGGLTRAVDAKEPEALASLDGKINPSDGVDCLRTVW